MKTRNNYKSKELVEHEIILKPSDYLIEGNRIKNNFKGIENEFLNLINEECQPAFMPIDVPAPRGPLFVFGEYFMKKFYTVFDRDENVVGLSLANHKPENENLNKIFTPYDNIVESNNINKENKSNNLDKKIRADINDNSNNDEMDFNKFMDSLNQNNSNGKFFDDIIDTENKVNKNSNNNVIKNKIMDFDLEIEDEKNSNFLLNSETVKLTTDDIDNVHLDLGLISESNTRSYLDN